MNDKKFSRAMDEVLLALAVLKRLGAGNISSFSERLRSQKVQYIAQLFGISPKYKFNLYIKGPYSPPLASDLFIAEKKSVNVETIKFVSDELEIRFSTVKHFIEKKTTRELEVISTYYWLLKEAYLPDEKALQELKKIKSPTKEELALVEESVKVLQDEKNIK